MGSDIRHHLCKHRLAATLYTIEKYFSIYIIENKVYKINT